jgi:EAL domain-containing protein (putative c-di-GMP-specific phosphodiesterase class I)
VDEEFLDRMDQQLTGWSDPAGQLQAALDNDELTLFCQPIRALAGTQDYPMAEVLVRMHSEEKALLPPGEFLPVFEHYRMMPQLDRWVVRTVARFLERGSRIPRFTINLSGQTLGDPEFPAYVADQAKVASIASDKLMFEIDEADILAHPLPAELAGSMLKRAGCGTLFDSFGRKSASFAPLKSLRVDFIKVDGSITRRVLSSSAAETKLKAILRVGEALGVGIIAEFVEDQDVLVRLKALGVGYAQGFGVTQPHPIDAVAASTLEGAALLSAA